MGTESMECSLGLKGKDPNVSQCGMSTREYLRAYGLQTFECSGVLLCLPGKGLQGEGPGQGVAWVVL